MTYRELNLASTAFLILAGISFALCNAEYKRRLWSVLVEWLVRIAIVGWIGTILVEVILFPKELGADISHLMSSTGW